MIKKVVGIVDWISGPVVKVVDVHALEMMELVEVGEERLIGEVIELDGTKATIQVYENTTGLKPGSFIYSTGIPLSVELGPGLIGNIYDGIQRPLKQIFAHAGNFIDKGVKVHPLDRERKWPFSPIVREGDLVGPGSVLGVVPETPIFEHRILLPPNLEGKVDHVLKQGEYRINEPIIILLTSQGRIKITMLQHWPVRIARPYLRRLLPETPLITGQRVIDIFFPIAKGGTAGLPGGFGTGKTITQHQLSKWSDADIIVYIGCGERGNEMTGVLTDFPRLVDVKKGRPLMERTILIANTSDMPLAAREASIYTGITICEYYRDMGYDVALMADSTSRWAEALREISGRLEEMPAEEGFPAYLASRLGKFYERAGRVKTMNQRTGSLTAICAVSPPGGDFSECVTQHTKRFVRCFWGLNKELASARYFPAINYMDSYSEYLDLVQNWWQKEVDPRWRELREEAMRILQQDYKLQRIIKLIGEDALPDNQRLILETARLIKDAFLQQNAFDQVDTYAVPKKQFLMLKIIMHFYHRACEVIKTHIPIYRLLELPVLNDIHRMKENIPNNEEGPFDSIIDRIDKQVEGIEKECMSVL
ncbi:MAG: V-type ATP synthase subunit A [Deltaproteobacteria bacterium]|nr:MAG: V-type ATP synthase subunit A [Deltaproteobacteria bacterium]